ncbi:signal peptidase I [filamentous cyanobacterium CCP5]|nr:signal peptidase I [filamentous cyanobacterium CCP5]
MARSRVYVRAGSTSSPWLAVNLSAVVPGWGQIYGGAWTKGICFLLTTLFGIGWIVHAIFLPSGNTVRGLWLLLPLGGLYLMSLWDSYHTVARHSPLTINQDPWYPVFLSHVLPGMGQLNLQLALWGVSFLLLGIGFGFLANLNANLLPIPPLIWAIGCGHAYIRATRTHQWTMLLGFLAVLITIRLAVGSIPAVVRLTVEQCIVPSESMVPTLQVDDLILVNKARTYTPQLQDIIVFEAPPQAIALDQLQPDDLVVKRILGLPGQQVAVQNGQVWINGSPVVEPYLAQPPDYLWGPETVPDNQLFVLGDNRNSSADSHRWGFISQSLVVGPAYKIYWPPQRIQPLS